jgi:hypothetical protein
MMSTQRLTVFLTTSLVVLALGGIHCGGGGGGGPDKITCTVNADCDSDEFCSGGQCGSTPAPCTTKADCAADEVCTNGGCV